jgi:DNA mismatch endonuclease (patch repair protein)
MTAQRRRDTQPEVELRRALHRLGLRFRIDRAPLPTVRSRADIVFSRARVAVFVDGCFWHGCPTHGTLPKANRDWWKQKLLTNRERDNRVSACLMEGGWLPIRVWEHQDPQVTALDIASAVSERRTSQERLSAFEITSG